MSLTHLIALLGCGEPTLADVDIDDGPMSH